MHEDEKRRYTLTQLGTMLRTDEPGSMRAWARVILGDELDRAWQALPHAMRTGENTFYNVFGTDLWSYFSTHLDRSNLLNAAMQSLTQGVNAAVGTHYPFGNFGWVVDVVVATERCYCQFWHANQPCGARSSSYRMSPPQRGNASPRQG